jgi:hypothetical protein
MQESMFSSGEDFRNLTEILEKWTRDDQNIKGAFVRLANRFSDKTRAVLSFVPRPGISYSLRAGIRAEDEVVTLVTLVDIVDDDPDNKWLSVCFYDDRVTDPAGEGNMVPKGVLGIDGYCFDLFENSEEIISYLEQRIDEAYENTLNH